ncbi:MAG: DUF305 domain-containing protein [Bauldia sp.]
MKTLFIALGVALALGLAALATKVPPSIAAEMGGMHDMMDEMPGMNGEGMMGGMSQPKGDDGPSSLAFQGANNKMHRAMAITYSGDADVDFVKGMIPHHAGAIDMAKIVIAFGSDPEIRKLAEGIVKAQEGEIAVMQEWLKKKAQ